MRVQQVDTKLYNYFVKGNYSLDKKVEKPQKMVQNYSEEACISIFNLKQIIEHEIYEIFLKDKDKAQSVK